MRVSKPSICRNCLAYCPIVVTVEDGRVAKAEGDRAATPFEGYICPKGRALPEQHNDPARLLHSLRRSADGTRERIAAGDAVALVARRVQEIAGRHGPRSIALYTGTGPVSHPSGAAIAKAWFRALGSPMTFSAATIDKPAAHTSTALHGNWHAGAQSFESSDTWMIVGANPVIAKSNGAPLNNPGMRLKEAVRRGLKLIVVDPRRSETARRAAVHLQSRPGEDVAVLAGMIHILLRDGLVDREFIAANADNADRLREAVADWTPEYAADRGGIPVEALLEAARVFGKASRGGVVCSTGPSFATHSNLSWYLALCLNTLCGRWAREGDPAPYANVLLPAFTPRAQAYAPYPVVGSSRLPATGLRENASGLPTAALADEILSDGEDRIRVLFCQGGNPVLAWPDQRKAEAALARLDLLVVFDTHLTATAELADYVIASPMTLEVPGVTHKVEVLKYFGVSRGYEMPWAQYTPAIVSPPPDADLMEDSEFFFRLAQEMRLSLEWVNQRGYGPHLESPTERVSLDMRRVPTTDELIELACAGSRIPLSEVKRHPHGKLFDEVRPTVAPREAACAARFELGDPSMMEELRNLRQSGAVEPPGYPYRLICRRMNNIMNSVGRSIPALGSGSLDNPAWMHPEDLAELGIEAGARLTVASANGEILARVATDASLRRGVVAVGHGFGARLGSAGARGGSVNVLLDDGERDPVTGIPRMTGVPVRIAAA